MRNSLTEVILAQASGKKDIKPGDIVDVGIDRLMINDFVGPMVRHEFKKASTKVVIQNKILVSVDHGMPPATLNEANNLVYMRQFCRQQGITRLADIGNHGIGHQLMVEDFVLPGEVAVGTDSHSTMYGALGAFGCGITASDAVVGMSTGKLWFQVPPTIRIDLSGSPGKWITGKDIALHIMTFALQTNFNYKAIEIGGDGLTALSMDSRFAIANLLAESDAKNVILEPDKTIYAYVGMAQAQPLTPDADAVYEQRYHVDLSKIEPLVACPDNVTNVKPLRHVIGKHVDQVFIGSCTNGRIEDLQQAVQILHGKKVSPGTRLIVVPASQKVYREAIDMGLISSLLDSGAAILTPSCASCAGSGAGLIGDGEVCVSTTNRNFKGRMGSATSEVYLSSAYTAAMAALTGELALPHSVDAREDEGKFL